MAALALHTDLGTGSIGPVHNLSMITTVATTLQLHLLVIVIRLGKIGFSFSYHFIHKLNMC